MARWMAEGDDKLYRAVVVDKQARKTFYGPYEHKRTAGFVKSYMTGIWPGSTQDSWIEETQTQWYRND